MRFEDGAWSRLPLSGSEDLWWVAPHPDGRRVMVGAGPRALAWQSGATSEVPVDAAVPANATLYGVWFAPTGEGWAVGGDPNVTEPGGSRGVLLRFADDPQLIAMAKRSGCQSLIVGLESLNRKNLEQMKKGWNPLEQYRERLGRLRRAGIMVWGTFVFGYDDDRPDIFSRTVDFAIREKLFIANFNPLQALPGTPLYDRLLGEGRLVSDRWWLDPQYRWHDSTIVPRGMSPDELTRGCAFARAKFNSLSSSARRFIGSHANCCDMNNAVTFLLSNFFSWLDIRAKSGMKLGGPKSGPFKLEKVA